VGCQQPQQQTTVQLRISHTTAAAAAKGGSMRGFCVHGICMATCLLLLLLLLPCLQESFAE
jgi:hypothetical protein